MVKYQAHIVGKLANLGDAELPGVDLFGDVGKGRSCQCEGVSEESQGDPECQQEVTVRKEKPACCRGRIVKGLNNVFVKLAWQIGVEWVAIASFHVVMQVLVVIQQL